MAVPVLNRDLPCRQGVNRQHAALAVAVIGLVGGGLAGGQWALQLPLRRALPVFLSDYQAWTCRAASASAINPPAAYYLRARLPQEQALAALSKLGYEQVSSEWARPYLPGEDAFCPAPAWFTPTPAADAYLFQVPWDFNIAWIDDDTLFYMHVRANP
jgi:hypothetical protein